MVSYLRTDLATVELGRSYWIFLIADTPPLSISHVGEGGQMSESCK